MHPQAKTLRDAARRVALRLRCTLSNTKVRTERKRFKGRRGELVVEFDDAVLWTDLEPGEKAEEFVDELKKESQFIRASVACKFAEGTKAMIYASF